MTKGVSLQLTPMEISDSIAQAGSDIGLAEKAPSQSEIVVHPGERCRVALELKNWESYPQQLTLKLDGTFPLEWCQTEAEPQRMAPLEQGATHLATVDIPAKQSWYADLCFQVPPTFFEDQDIWPAHAAEPLELNFQGCLSVCPASSSAAAKAARSPIQQSSFDLYVRPRSLYTTFLPTVYQEIDIIHRFVKIFEEAFDPVVNSFSSMWAHLDPLTAPQSLLPFLAHWVDWPLDAQLSLTQQRRLIRRAVEIYRSRGTRKGLRFYLHLYTGLPLDEGVSREEDKSISITEPSGQGCLLGVAQMGVDTILGGGKAYHFEVCLRCEQDYPIDEELVRRIIEQEKPAFCTYDLWIENR
ncbi:MAG: phage tail protein [Chloroflexi bacterium AL-N5]|nr:phage tail protein [Chloroflexi bacterium AL-N5]